MPDTSFRGLRTRTARRVLRSTCVLKWVPAVARMLQMETQRVTVTAGWLSPLFTGAAGSKEDQPSKRTELIPVLCGTPERG